MSSLNSTRLAFLGGGNMANAFINGLLATGLSPLNIIVAEPWDVAREHIAKLGVETTVSNPEAAAKADIVIIAVKPQVAKEVCVQAASAWSTSSSLPVILSIAAGITLASLRNWLTTPEGQVPHIVRVMPNTPALVGEGASGIIAAPDVADNEKQLVQLLMNSISRANEWVSDESLLDIVTGLSGSGPAYIFLMAEHMIASAVAQGMPRDQATRLATQTCLGAGKMLVTSQDGPAQLRKNVTSPYGTTWAAMNVFEALELGQIIQAGVKAATDRSIELGKPSDQD